MGSDLQQSAAHRVAVHKGKQHDVHDQGLSETSPILVLKSNCQ